MIRTVDSYEEFKEEIEKGGFLLCPWDGTPETEEKIKSIEDKISTAAGGGFGGYLP